MFRESEAVEKFIHQMEAIDGINMKAQRPLKLPHAFRSVPASNWFPPSCAASWRSRKSPIPLPHGGHTPGECRVQG